MTAGATADPVDSYLKQISKVALLDAEQEVEAGDRAGQAHRGRSVRRGEAQDSPARSTRRSRVGCGGSPGTARTPGTTTWRPTSSWSSPWPRVTPGRGMFFLDLIQEGQPRSEPCGREVRLHQGLQSLRHLPDVGRLLTVLARDGQVPGGRGYGCGVCWVIWRCRWT
jgi:hypothetical protein